jgi:hypothetical protein
MNENNMMTTIHDNIDQRLLLNQSICAIYLYKTFKIYTLLQYT